MHANIEPCWGQCRNGGADESTRQSLGASVLGLPGTACSDCNPMTGHRCAVCVQRSLGLRVTEDRVLIRADREDHAPTQTDSGLYLAASLTAAVEGEDEGDSWFVGTIVQLGPLVDKRDVRSIIARWILEMEREAHDVSPIELMALRQRVEGLSTDMPDPLLVGNRVAFSWAAGQQIAIEGDKYLILRAGDVLAVLEDE